MIRKNNESVSALPASVGSLDAILIRRDGSHHDLGCISDGKFKLVGRPLQWWRSLWGAARKNGAIPLSMGFATFMAIHGAVEHVDKLHHLLSNPVIHNLFFLGDQTMKMGLVVQAGVNFLATDFASGQASPRISAMNFHDSGTGTTAATSTDTALQTQAGPTTRATGTQSNPTSGQYRSVGTISYTTTLAITEWGLFNQAAQGGTMWDHRVFSAINVVNGDSVQFTYTLTINAGGS